MLGSPFDLKREISRIAARRAAAEAETRSDDKLQAYTDFDDQVRAFVRAFGVDDGVATLPPHRTDDHRRSQPSRA